MGPRSASCGSQSAATMSDFLCFVAVGNEESNMAASLLMWLNRLQLFMLLCPLCVPGFLNLEELNEMKYGIQILPDPVILGQVGESIGDS